MLVLSQYVEEQYATELVASRSTGVGYLLKDRVTDVDEFLAALDAVARRFPTAAVRPASLLGRREARADARRDAPRPGTGGPDRD